MFLIGGGGSGRGSGVGVGVIDGGSVLVSGGGGSGFESGGGGVWAAAATSASARANKGRVMSFMADWVWLFARRAGCKEQPRTTRRATKLNAFFQLQFAVAGLAVHADEDRAVADFDTGDAEVERAVFNSSASPACTS